MLLRSGRRTSTDSVNITDRQAEYPNFHEPNVSEDINMANQTLKQLAAPNLAAQLPSIMRSDLGKRMDEGQSSMMEAQLANLTAMEGEANAVFPNQRRYDPYSATYNEGWRDHPNLRYQNRATPPGFDGKELRSTLKKVQNSDKEDEIEVKKVRFSDIEEENLALPKADLQSSQIAPKEAGKSRLQQPTASHNAANFEQEMRVPELRAQAR
ncbi:hypothetical protein GOBAR_DD05316 [Gossypium barbadense]|nr:hypothetical protein GOBAR_DD05316 [Gossypium barbadense]